MELVRSQQDESYMLGMEEIDKQHGDFLNLMEDLKSSQNADFPPLFKCLCEHITAHFEFEDALMQESKFPAISEHRGEHQRILGELVQLSRKIEKGRLMMARAYITERLPEWLNLHLQTMDSALVAHVKKDSP